jgi:hypothetical protein
MHGQLIVGYGNDRLEALFLLEEGGFQVDELGFQDGFDLGLELVQLAFIVGEYGDVDAHVEKVFLGLHQLVAELFQVLIGGIQCRVAYETLFFATRDLALYLRHFLLEMAQDLGRINRVYEYGDIEYLIQIDYRREPAFVQKAWI